MLYECSGISIKYLEKSNCLEIMARWSSYYFSNIFLAVMVHGWLFRVETGFIEELSLEDSIPEEMSKIFKIKFNPPKN